MSETAIHREQFRTGLECIRCGARGHALWEEEENAGIVPEGPMGRLVALSEGFFQRMAANHQGQPQIACAKCGTAHAD